MLFAFELTISTGYPNMLHTLVVFITPNIDLRFLVSWTLNYWTVYYQST